MLKKSINIGIMVTLFVILMVSAGLARKMPYKIIEIQGISRYSEDRIAFQHIEKVPLENVIDKTDNSVACLLIIKSKKIFLFKDGYDNPYDVETRRWLLETEKKLVPDLWTNKTDDSPDFLRITERRIEVLKNTNPEFVTKNYKDKYTKWRDAFLKRHVSIFRSLMVNRKESGLYVKRRPIAKKFYHQGAVKFRIAVSAKTIDGKVYYAEDHDGDGLTETFTVRIPDGFHWGYKSGPNIIFIYKVGYKDAEGKERNTGLKNLIGKLSHDAYYGTEIENRIIQKTFPKEQEVTDMIDDIYQIDPEFKKIMDDHSEAK